MWQRFTERARRVVFFAQEEAARLGENYVGTEHLLLGLVRESDSVAGRLLARPGVPRAGARPPSARTICYGASFARATAWLPASWTGSVYRWAGFGQPRCRSRERG